MCMTSIGIYQELLQDQLPIKSCVLCSNIICINYFCVSVLDFLQALKSSVDVYSIYAVQKIYITDIYKQIIRVHSYMLIMAV